MCYYEQLLDEVLDGFATASQLNLSTAICQFHIATSEEMAVLSLEQAILDDTTGTAHIPSHTVLADDE